MAHIIDCVDENEARGCSMLQPFYELWFAKEEAARRRSATDPEKDPEACALLESIEKEARRKMRELAVKIRERV